MQRDPWAARARSLRKSLRNVSDSREDLRRRRSNVKAASSLHHRNDSSASARGQQFRVGNVAPNGHIYLRPAGPAPPRNGAPLTPPDSPQGADQTSFPEEPWRESFVSHPDASNALQIVIKPPMPAVRNGVPLLDTSIPHFRMGRPRFTDHGSAVLTDSYVTGDSSQSGSHASQPYSLRHYANMFPAPPRTPESPEFRPRTASSSPEAVKGLAKGGSKADDLLGRNTPDVPSATPLPDTARHTPGIRRMFGSIRRALSQKRVPRISPASGPISAWRRPSEPLSGFTKTISLPLQSCTWLNCACADPASHDGRHLQSRDQPSRSMPHTPFNELETAPPLRAPVQQMRTSRSAPMLNLQHLAAPDPVRVASNVTLGSRSIVIFNDTANNTPIEPQAEAWLMPPSVCADSPIRESQDSRGSRMVPLFLESTSSADSRPSEEQPSRPPRSLRRRPGGNLKLAENVHDLEKIPSSSPLSNRLSMLVPQRSSSLLSLSPHPHPQQQRSFYLADDTPPSRHAARQDSNFGDNLPPRHGSSTRETFLMPSRSSSILRESHHTDLEALPKLHGVATDLAQYHGSTDAASPILRGRQSGNSLAIPSRTTSMGATRAGSASLSAALYSGPSRVSSHPLVAKGTYEAELLRLAELPDGNEEDGGIEAALRRLEGRQDDDPAPAKTAEANISHAQDQHFYNLPVVSSNQDFGESIPEPVEQHNNVPSTSGGSFRQQSMRDRPTTASTSGAGATSYITRDIPGTPRSMNSMKHSEGTGSVTTGGTASAPNTPQVPHYSTIPSLTSLPVKAKVRADSEIAARQTQDESIPRSAINRRMFARSSH